MRKAVVCFCAALAACLCTVRGQGRVTTASNSTVVLEAGVWPISEEQRRCIVASAGASEAWARFTAAGMLIGSALLDGDESNVTYALLGIPDVQAVLSLPFNNITGGLEEWVAEAMEECGVPQFELVGPNSTDPQSMHAAMTAWLQTVDEADVIGFVPLPENATDEEALAYATEEFGPLMQSGAFPATSFEAEPPGRRLLYAAGLIQNEGAAIELAYVLGIVTSLGSSLVTAGLTEIQIVAGAANTAWKTIGNTLGLATGNLLSMEAQSSLNDDMATLFTAVTDDVTVEQAFLSGQALAGVLSMPSVGGLDGRVKKLWPLVKSVSRTFKKAGKETWKALQEIVRLMRNPSSNKKTLKGVISKWIRNTETAFSKGQDIYDLQDAITTAVKDMAGAAVFAYQTFACDNCIDGEPSTAVVATAGTPYFTTPCAKEDKFKIGVLTKCYKLTLTGRRSPSICGESTCFAEAKESDASGRYVLVWLADHACNGQPGTAITAPGTQGCPGSGAGASEGTSDPRKLSLVQASPDSCRNSHPCWVSPGGLRVVSDLGSADHSGAWDLVLSFVDTSTLCQNVGFEYNNAMDHGEGIDENDPNSGTFPASIPIQHTDDTYTLFMAPIPGKQLLSIMTTDGCEFHYSVSCGAILGVGSQTLSNDCFENGLPGQCGTLAVGTDLEGGVLNNCGDAGTQECRLRPTKDVAACCAACGSNPLCSAFTFRSTDSVCWLQDALGTTEQPNAGAFYSAKMTSPASGTQPSSLPGQCGTLAVGTDLEGGVLNNCGDAGTQECRLRPTKDVAACCAACGSNPLCSAFTFRSTDSVCWLQDALHTTEQPNAGAFYSAKMVQP